MSDQLRQRNTVDIRDIIYSSPSLQLSGNVTNNSEGFQIRGVGTSVFGNLQQSYLEEANVNAVTEISDLIAAQRAYEMNAKVVSATDQMLQSTTAMIR